MIFFKLFSDWVYIWAIKRCGGEVGAQHPKYWWWWFFFSLCRRIVIIQQRTSHGSQLQLYWTQLFAHPNHWSLLAKMGRVRKKMLVLSWASTFNFSKKLECWGITVFFLSFFFLPQMLSQTWIQFCPPHQHGHQNTKMLVM